MLHHFFYQIRYNLRGWTPFNYVPYLWMMAADATNTGDGTAVTAWISHEGNNYLFTTADSPLYHENGNNSKPTVEFENSEYVEYVRSFFDNDGFTIALLINFDTNGTHTIMYQEYISEIQKQFAVRTVEGYLNIIQDNGGVEVSLIGSTFLSGWHVILINSDGVKINRRGICSRPIDSLELLQESITVRVDTLPETMLADGATGLFSPYNSLIFQIGGSTEGEVQQLLVYPQRVPTGVLQDHLESYLMTYGGI